MKNVLNIINVYFSVPYFFGDQFLYLKNKGYHMHLICSPSTELAAYAKQQEISYAEIPVTRKITPFTDLVSLIKVCQYIKRNQIDIVVGHTSKGGLLAALAGRIMHVKKIIFFRHGSPIDRNTGLSKMFLLWINRCIASCSHQIVCVSPSIAAYSLALKLNPPEKQLVLGKGTCGGIDTKIKFNPSRLNASELEQLKQKLDIQSDSFVIGYCGRLVNDKGIPELVDAFEIISKKFPEKNLILLLVGPFQVENKKERDELQEKTKKRIFSNPRIITTGYISNHIALYYAIMSIYVLPSYHEGFGMSILEASAMQLPVLTTRSVGCVDAIVENETGLYVDLTPEGIADGIVKLFDPVLRHQMGLKGREMVKNNYDHEILWPEIEKLYH